MVQYHRRKTTVAIVKKVPQRKGLKSTAAKRLKKHRSVSGKGTARKWCKITEAKQR